MLGGRRSLVNARRPCEWPAVSLPTSATSPACSSSTPTSPVPRPSSRPLATSSCPCPRAAAGFGGPGCLAHDVGVGLGASGWLAGLHSPAGPPVGDWRRPHRSPPARLGDHRVRPLHSPVSPRRRRCQTPGRSHARLPRVPRLQDHDSTPPPRAAGLLAAVPVAAVEGGTANRAAGGTGRAPAAPGSGGRSARAAGPAAMTTGPLDEFAYRQ